MRNRPLSLPAHGAIEFLAGIVMMLAPVALRAVVLLQAALSFGTRYAAA
jgi:hypothetical protein